MPKDLFKKSNFFFTPTDKQALDPDTGCANDIQWWGKLYFDAEIFPWQAYFYHAPQKDKLVAAGIRTGKSKGASFFLLHYAQFHPGARILNTSISSEQAKIVYHGIMELIVQDRFKHWIEHTERSPYPLIRLVNGAEIWFRSIGYDAELIRGFQFDLINIDEAAYVTSEMAINTLRGRLLGVNPITQKPLAGLFWSMTSPKGKVGWLYNRWKKGDPKFLPASDPRQYLSLRVRTTDNPLLDQNILKEIMAEYTDRMIRQELEGEFIDDDGAEFNLDEIMFCCSVHTENDEVDKLEKAIARWRERREKKVSLRAQVGVAEEIEYFELDPEPGHQYIASWDLGKKSLKNGRNATVGMVWDITELPWRMVGYRYEQGTSYLAALGWIEQMHIKYSSMGTNCYTVIDASGKGDVLNEIIEAENRIMVDGIVYSNQLKPNLITSGKIAIERSMVRFPHIRRMVDQLSTYTQNDKDIAQDIVMAFCQAMHKARELTGITSAKSNILTPSIYRRQNIGMSSMTRRYADRRRSSIHLRSGRSR